MFIENKYTKIYKQLMEKGRNRRQNLSAIERHHIVPRSLGGNNTRGNIVELTPREHFISHALLTKMCENPKHKRSMAYAFFVMDRSRSSAGYSRVGNGRLYEKMRESLLPLIRGENNHSYGVRKFGKENHFFGKKHSSESRRKMSESQTARQMGESNSFFGKKHSEEAREKIRMFRSTPILVKFKNGKEVRFASKGELGPYLGKSVAMGIQLTTIKKRMQTKYGIEGIAECD